MTMHAGVEIDVDQIMVPSEKAAVASFLDKRGEHRPYPRSLRILNGH